jgi:hypothetical protein
MSLFDLPVDEYKEPEVVPEGEYDLMIHAYDESPAQSGRPMVTCQIQVLNPPATVINPSRIWHRVLGLLPTDPPETRNAMLGNGRSFAQVFGLSSAEISNPMEWPGHTGKCLVIIEQDNNAVNRNVLKLPRPKK